MRIKILKIITVINLMIALLSACCLDSESWLPKIACLISSAWLLLIAIANTPKGSDHHRS